MRRWGKTPQRSRCCRNPLSSSLLLLPDVQIPFLGTDLVIGHMPSSGKEYMLISEKQQSLIPLEKLSFDFLWDLFPQHPAWLEIVSRGNG